MSAAQVQRPPVMADVARLAGVSHQTVSRVLNGHPSVSPDTRQRVEQAIGHLGYRRNEAARALVTRRTRLLGVISIDTHNYGPASMLHSIEEAGRAAGYYVSFVSLRVVNRTTMTEAFDHLRSAGVDGVVVIAPIRPAFEAVAGLGAELPLVVVEGTSGDGVSAVVIDQVYGARLVTRQLLDLGHRTVHHIRGPHSWIEADGRVEGWRTELGARGVAAPEIEVGDWSPQSGYEAAKRLARDPEVTAIFAANDQMAVGVLLALHEEGRRVPREISVAGFDDIPEAGFLIPPLTTVRQDFAEVGRLCLQQLTSLIAGDAVAAETIVRPQLIVRSSTGPAPTRG